MDLNKVQLIGNNTKDVELTTIPSGQKVAKFSVATNRNWVDANWEKQEQVEFHNIVFWGKLAEIANDYVKKWMKVYIEGRLQTRNWEAQDGTKRYATEIIWENLIMLGWSKKETSEKEVTKKAPKKEAPKKDEEISVEDIPF